MLKMKNMRFKLESKLCGKTIPEEDVIPDQKYQICYECEVRMEVGC